MSALLQELDRIKALAEAATKGPWEETRYTDGVVEVSAANMGGRICRTIADDGRNSAFIAEARTLIPRMERALRIQNEKLEHIARVCASEAFKSVFTIADIHGCNYRGEQFGVAEGQVEALAALRGTDE